MTHLSRCIRLSVYGCGGSRVCVHVCTSYGFARGCISACLWSRDREHHMCLSVCACLFMLMYVFACFCVYEGVYLCLSFCLCVCAMKRTFVCTWVRLCVYAWAHTCFLHMWVHICVYRYAFARSCEVRACIGMYLCVCV